MGIDRALKATAMVVDADKANPAAPPPAAKKLKGSQAGAGAPPAAEDASFDAIGEGGGVALAPPPLPGQVVAEGKGGGPSGSGGLAGGGPVDGSPLAEETAHSSFDLRTSSGLDGYWGRLQYLATSRNIVDKGRLAKCFPGKGVDAGIISQGAWGPMWTVGKGRAGPASRSIFDFCTCAPSPWGSRRHH